MTSISLILQDSGAMFSDDRKYRYALWRAWDKDKPIVMFIMLNPSTANEIRDDPTIRKCIAYTKAWGYGALVVGNLYAFRSRNPRLLGYEKNPMGPHCDSWLYDLSKMSDLRIAAWGNNILSIKRVQQVRNLIPNLHYLELSKSGNPKHPLYLRKNLKPQSF